jgi:hypothetical protein
MRNNPFIDGGRRKDERSLRICRGRSAPGGWARVNGPGIRSDLERIPLIGDTEEAGITIGISLRHLSMELKERGYQVLNLEVMLAYISGTRTETGLTVEAS